MAVSSFRRVWLLQAFCALLCLVAAPRILAAPTIQSVSPGSAALGQQVRLNVAGVPSGVSAGSFTVHALQNALDVVVTPSSVTPIAGTSLYRVVFVLPKGAGLLPTSAGAAAQSAQLQVAVTNGGTSPAVAFDINPPASIVSIAPASLSQGAANTDVTLTTAYANLRKGLTTVSFGAGVTVNSLTFSNASIVVANVTVSANANTGVQVVTLKTGTETLTSDKFSIVEAPKFTLSLALDQDLVPRAGQVTPTLVVKDANGDVVNNPDVNLTLTGVAPFSGSGSLVSGKITFTNDASGSFLVQASLVSDPTLTDSKTVLVLGTGFATPLLDLHSFLTGSGALLQDILNANTALDSATLQADVNALNSLKQKAAFQPSIQILSRAFNPQSGTFPTHGAIVAKNPALGSSPDDATFATTLTTLRSQLETLQQKIAALPDNPTDAANADLTAAKNAFKATVAQFQTLNPSPAALADNLTAFNNLFATTLPVTQMTSVDKTLSILDASGFHPQDDLISQAAAFAVSEILNSIETYDGMLRKAGQQAAAMAALMLINDVIQAWADASISIDDVQTGFSFNTVAADAQAIIYGSGFSYDPAKNYAFAIGPNLLNALKDLLSNLNTATSSENVFEALKAVYEFAEGASSLSDKVASVIHIETVGDDEVISPQYMYTDGAGFPAELLEGAVIGISNAILVIQNLDTMKFNSHQFILVR